MKHLIALGVSLLVLVPTPLAAQTAGSGRRLTVVSAGPTGEVASLAEANEIRIVFSEPMVALGRIPAVVRPPYVTISPAIPGAFRCERKRTVEAVVPMLRSSSCCGSTSRSNRPWSRRT